MVSGLPLSELPHRSIALVQSEFETSHAPAYDISIALRGQLEPWSVETHSDRSIHAVLEALSQFDCVILGYNAVAKSPEIAEALRARPPRTNLVLLHQLHNPEIGSFVGDFAVEFTTS